MTAATSSGRTFRPSWAGPMPASSSSGSAPTQGASQSATLASIGVSTPPGDGVDVDAVLRPFHRQERVSEITAAFEAL